MTALIKICGITTPELAYETALAGANYIGIMCFKRSKRYVEFDLAKEIGLAAKAGGAIPVLVCVDQHYDELMRLVEITQVTTLQLHGDISRQTLNQLPREFTKIYVVSLPIFTPFEKEGRRMVIRRGDFEPHRLKNKQSLFNHLTQSNDFLLFDSHNPGTGQSIQTRNLDELANGYRYFLAGGLTADYIKKTEFRCHPTGFDVSSGVENSDGIKKIDKIRAFIQAVGEVRYLC